MDIDLTRCFLTTKIVGAAMIKHDEGGVIIDRSSISGMIADKGVSGRHHEACRAAVIHFTSSTVADWAPHDIRVDAI